MGFFLKEILNALKFCIIKWKKNVDVKKVVFSKFFFSVFSSIFYVSFYMHKVIYSNTWVNIIWIRIFKLQRIIITLYVLEILLPVDWS